MGCGHDTAYEAAGADGELQDKTQYISALKAGDTVAVYQLSDSEVLILEKMVSV